MRQRLNSPANREERCLMQKHASWHVKRCIEPTITHQKPWHGSCCMCEGMLGLSHGCCKNGSVNRERTSEQAGAQLGLCSLISRRSCPYPSQVLHWPAPSESKDRMVCLHCIRHGMQGPRWPRCDCCDSCFRDHWALIFVWIYVLECLMQACEWHWLTEGCCTWVLTQASSELREHAIILPFVVRNMQNPCVMQIRKYLRRYVGGCPSFCSAQRPSAMGSLKRWKFWRARTKRGDKQSQDGTESIVYHQNLTACQASHIACTLCLIAYNRSQLYSCEPGPANLTRSLVKFQLCFQHPRSISYHISLPNTTKMHESLGCSCLFPTSSPSLLSLQGNSTVKQRATSESKICPRKRKNSAMDIKNRPHGANHPCNPPSQLYRSSENAERTWANFMDSRSLIICVLEMRKGWPKRSSSAGESAWQWKKLQMVKWRS